MKQFLTIKFLRFCSIFSLIFGFIFSFGRAYAQKVLPTTKPETWNIHSFDTLITNVTNIALSVAGTVAGIFIVIGGFQYLTAYGDEAKATAGKTTLTWAIVGLVVVILSKVIVSQIWGHITAQTSPF